MGPARPLDGHFWRLNLFFAHNINIFNINIKRQGPEITLNGALSVIVRLSGDFRAAAAAVAATQLGPKVCREATFAANYRARGKARKYDLKAPR